MNPDQAFVDGQTAYFQGKDLNANPYSPAANPTLFDAWASGWLDERDFDANNDAAVSQRIADENRANQIDW
jgi:hypothetical protein